MVTKGQVPAASSPGKVQLLSQVNKAPQDLEDGEQGIMVQFSIETFDPSSHRRLQRMADGAALRQGYAIWYSTRGGRKVEKELVSTFNGMSRGSELANFSAGRFQAIVRKAFELEQDDDDSKLLEMCKAAITTNGKFKADEFITLQRIIAGVNADLHNDISSEELLAAADRLLPNTAIVQALMTGN